MARPEPKTRVHTGLTSRARRMAELATLAASYGLDHFLAMTGLVRRRRRKEGATGASPSTTTPERLRDFFAAAGTTFVKLGQRLSTRADLLPPEYVEAFSTLHDRVPAPPADALREAIEAELGQPIDAVFASLSPSPVASASIGCVFRGTLVADGSEVAVKVRRPGIRSKVALDLAILADVAHRAEQFIPSVKTYHPTAVVREFADALWAELDFREEARRTIRLRATVAKHSGIRVPAVVESLSTSRLLVTEWIDGVAANVPEALDALGLSDDARETAAHNLASSILNQALHDGCFHADPHPGNLRVQQDGSVALLDFGNVCYIGRHSRAQLQRLLTALFLERADQVVTVLISMGVVGPNVNIHLLQHDIDRSIAEHLSEQQAPSFQDLIEDFLATIRTHRLGFMPPEWIVLLLAIGMAESTCKQLSAGFTLNRVGRDLTRRGLRDALPAMSRPFSWAKEKVLQAQGIGELIRTIPGRLERILTQVESGSIQVRLRHEDTAKNTQPFHSMANRLGLSLLLSVSLLSSSVLLASGNPDLLKLGGILLAIAAIGSAILFLAMLRSGGF